MSVNILSHRCFVCDEPMTMTSCLKVYCVSGLKEISADEQNMQENNTKYYKEFLHRSCKSQLIEEILIKMPTALTF